MKTRIALLRGINVGGANPLPMAELTTLLAALGARAIRTYIQSGNAVFLCPEPSCASLGSRLTAEIGKRHGFTPDVLVLTPEALIRAIEENPFPEAAGMPKTLHLGFLAAPPSTPDLARLDGLKRGGERFHLANDLLYLHLPDGAGRSKLAAGAERALGEPMTVRNWNTVLKLAEMAQTVDRSDNPDSPPAPTHRLE